MNPSAPTLARSARPLERLTLLAAGSALAAAVGAAAGWSGFAVAAAVISGAATLFSLRRRRAAVRKLELTANQILTEQPGPEPEPQRIGLAPQPAGQSVPAELAPVQRAIARLAVRLESEGKDLAKKTRNLESLIAAMDEPLLATDNDRCVLLCNRSAEAIFGAGVQPAPAARAAPAAGGGGLIGRPINQVFTHAELLSMHDAACAGEVRRGRVRLTTALGKRVFQVSASPVPVAWGEGVFGAVMVLRDVTELDQAVQVKTDFVANASHELRTPVAAIRSAAETLPTVLGDDPAMATRVAKMIVSHAGRLEELLRDLLDLSRLESPDVPLAVETLEPSELARHLAALFEPACRERGLRLVFDFEDELAGMRTDRKLLTLVLRNLIENATKFAFENTEIRITGQLVEADVPGGAPPAVAMSRPSRGIVRFEVIDRGIGIPIAQQDRVFERFYQVDPARTGGGKRGTGLGLAIVKHAAKALGGRVGLDSVWGQGTRVWVEVPVEFDAASGQARRAS